MNQLFHSAILKLTFFYLTLVMIISLLFSGALYQIATNEIRIGLRDQTARIYQQYPVFSGDPFFLRDSDATISAHRVLGNLIILNVCVLVSAGLASYWLARRTLQPIAIANEQQKRFVADASHELRTPLTAIKMETEVALMDTDAKAAALRQTLVSNLEESTKLEQLLNSLLRLSKLESDELVQSFTLHASSEIIDEAIARTDRRAKAKNVAVEYTRSGLALYGDRESLVELFTIILDNAIKYSPDGTTVRVTSSNLPKGTRVTIHDEGIGIEHDALEHVFDRFYRADKARGSDGHGLGLSIAKHIADLHGGSITLSSTVGKGTRVNVDLPAELPGSVR